MSTRLSSLAQILVRLYTLALRFYPAEVRGEVANEMQAVFRLKAADAAHHGAWALFGVACREARDLPPAIFLAYFHPVGGRMQPLFPATTDQTPWPTALLSLLPFMIAGPLAIILRYQPAWMPEVRSLYYFFFLLLGTLAITAGFLLGVVKKFPRWAYPYPVALAFSLYTLVGYAFYLMRINTSEQNSFFLYLAVILIILWLPGLRSYYRHIPQDWTLLSYSLYGIVLYLLSSIDFEEQPILNVLVLLPSLLTLCAALAHLRIRSALLRIAALLAGMFTALFFWVTPIFQGMISIWIGVAIGLFMMLVYGIILTAVILAPMLVARAIHSWRAAQASR